MNDRDGSSRFHLRETIGTVPIVSTYDKDANGYLKETERNKTETFNCSGLDIASLEGIEYFPNLWRLNAINNPNLTRLELNNFPNLYSIQMKNCALTRVSITGCPSLIALMIDGNPVTELDLRTCSSLNQLNVIGCTALRAVDISGNPRMGYLNVYWSGIKYLDIQSNPRMLAALDGTKTVGTEYTEYNSDGFYMRVNPDTEFSGTGCVPVDEAHFPDNTFRAYVAAHFDTNGSGWLNENEIAAATEINAYEYNASGFGSLEGIGVFTELSYLSLSDCPNLTWIDLSTNTKITDIDIWDTGLTSLDVHGMTLNFCSIARSPLTSLTLGAQPNLCLLACMDADLSSLDVTGCPLLLDAIVNGTRTEEYGYVSYESGTAELAVDADVQLITGLTLAVTFDTQDGSAVETQEITFGGAATAPTDPMKIGAVFTGWYTDATCSAEALYDFSAPVTTNMTLFAGWLIPEPNGILKLPSLLTAIETEAFSGTAAEAIIIPGTVTDVSGNPFACSDVRYIYGIPGSAAQTFAEVYDFTFVPVDNAWLTSH